MEVAIREPEERGVELFAGPFDLPPSGNRLAYIRDNSGNVVELAQALAKS